MSEVRALGDAEDRLAIREDLDTTLVVEAAAGTGKTTELVNRIVETLATGRAMVQEIVAVTFTEKAAGELKLRLRVALDRARAACGADAPRRDRVQAALEHLEEAQVGTIHAFCAELLRERPVEARVDPRFQVMLEPDSRRLHRRTFDRWLEDALENPPEGVRRSLRRRAGTDEHGARARLRGAAWTLAEWRDFPATWRRDPFDRDAALDGVVAALHAFARLSAGPVRRDDKLYADTWAARDLSARVAAMVEAGRFDRDGVEAALVDLSRDRRFIAPGKGYGARYGNGVSRADVQAAHAALVEALRVFREAADADLAALLQQELGAANAGYEELKSRLGRLDFVDLLLLARDLVGHNDDVRAVFQRRIRRIFVDEFQDTDPLQAELLMLLAADDPTVSDWRRVRPVPGKLFVVGDPKQSIYRFRRADVGIYQQVRDHLLAHGARQVTLRTSFRSLPSIQSLVNAAFGAAMRGDRTTLQADYVPLLPYRAESARQPSVVALPVPRPYGNRRITIKAIEESLPDAVCAFIDWLLRESGWTVAERVLVRDEGASAGQGFSHGEDRQVPVAPRHICVLFRRFESWGTDVTRPYVEGLQARGIPHLLVGGRSFHAREEVEAMRAALSAVEWPDDELCVFAAVHGPLFAVQDELLLEYRARFGRLHPFRLPAEPVPDRLTPIVEVLRVFRDLHQSRNHVPANETIERLLAAARAPASLVLRRSGEQALANVLHLADLARAYESSADASSFRGFIDFLADEAEAGESPEATILEEAADGVRVMTVHRAKGLEFPIVVLADMTASLTHGSASRYIDADRRLCAVRIGGWSPRDLIEHEADELARDAAEAVRVAYVAATRAKDLLVIPAVGDRPIDDKWVSALNGAIYPPIDMRRNAQTAPACPRFGRDTVLERPDGDPATFETVSPGLHRFSAAGPASPYSVVWWDPAALPLGAPPSYGIRAEDLIGKGADAALVDADARAYDAWKAERARTLEDAAKPSLVIRTATARAASRHVMGADSVESVDARAGQPRLAPDSSGPAGARLGSLVHAALASLPLDADGACIAQTVALQARILGATDDERRAAGGMIESAFAHPLVARARAAEREGRCRRETPVTLVDEDGALVEGIVDLAFEESDGWTVVDFKTARELERRAEVYRRQVALYAQAIAAATGRPARGVLMHL